MDWYYASKGERHGPTSVSELRELHRKGVIDDDSLVWSENMDDWRPYRECQNFIENSTNFSPGSLPDSDSIDGATGEPLATCAWSGRKLPQSSMLRYGDVWVAPGFKDVFVQSLEEGERPTHSQGPIPADELVPDLNFVSVIVQSAKIWWANLASIAIVTVAIWLPLNLLLEYIAYQQLAVEEDWEDILGGIRNAVRYDRIAEFWIGVIVTGATIWVANQTWIGRSKAGVGEALSAGLHNWPRMVGTRIVFGLLLFVLLIPFIAMAAFGESVLIALGIVYLIVAVGIYFVRHGFFEIAAISREEGGMPALEDSRSVTKGRFWRIICYQILVFGTLIAVSFVIGLLGIIPIFDNFVVSALLSTVINVLRSFTLVEMLVLYRDLEANPTS